MGHGSVDGLIATGTGNLTLSPAGQVNITTILNTSATAGLSLDSATTLAITSNFQTVDCIGAETLTTITGASDGTTLVLLFIDAECTVTDTDAHTADTFDLAGGNLTSADDTTLTMIYDGTSWYETARSVN